MLRSTFVSFAEEDRYFVDLLVEILRFHGVNVWCSNSSLTAGDQWRAAIHKAMNTADSLTVVVSQKASNSPWIKREVAVFLAMKPQAPVLPMLLDHTPMSAIDSDLERFQAVNFGMSMLSGFRALLKALGSDFLPNDAIVVADRRTGEDRRKGCDRRWSPISQRVRSGFWKAYQAESGAGKFDPVDSLGGKMSGLTRAVGPEAQKYAYLDVSGKRVPWSEALDNASASVYDAFRDMERPRIIYIVDALAEYMCRNYQLTMNERRQRERRTTSVLQPEAGNSRKV
ncbi:MAG: toll/interleukin-1 receptor domain-containing protein [Chloroflexi bacterium]|nr:toll/interleukin-1 receptor domain-containing protein [Chloroflexota bacterium]